MHSQQQSMAGPGAGQTQGVPASASPGILAGYRAPANRFDEFVTPAGAPRPVWQRLTQLLGSLGPAEFSRRWNHSQRLIYENGISYGAYGAPEGNARPWDLDALPILINKAEWEQVSAGIAQRATLLQLVLADLLGPQRLIKEGVLPLELLYGHDGFRLPFHGQLPPDGAFMPFYAADLGRAPDGAWWVLADRTESPSGAGFALENRVVLSRMLPEVFRSCSVQRLAPFFIDLKSRLRSLAHRDHENPRIVVYTRGPHHENYFEDAYLARYLGYNLVEGGDLAVRDDRVWLKTLDGLMPIDVVLRRPNSEMCDPLEFSDDSALGVPGLLRSARCEQVAIVNPLGSGLVESPAFMAFMPRLCKFLLGEELRLPGIATWWCGEPASLERVLANSEHLIFSSAFRQRGQGYQQDKALNATPVNQLRDMIRAAPHRYVAQERFALSSTPRWREGTAEAALLVLRSFAVSNGDSYSVMSGGLARTSALDDASPLVIPASQGSKDAWVLSDQPVEHVTLLSVSDEAVELRRTGGDLPSRVADNIYWLGRHIERADATAREMRTFVLRLTSETTASTDLVPTTLVRALAAQGQIEPGFALDDIRAQLPQIELALPRSMFDRTQPGSIRSVLDNMFRTASLVRDRLSTDSWRILVRIDQSFQGEDDLDLTDVLSLLNGLIIDLAAFEGMCMESMTRSHVFRFLDLGRRLERAQQMAGLLQSCLVEVTQMHAELLEAVLEIADSVMTYRSRYLANIQLPAVLDLLLTDESNPRSIAFQLATLQRQIERLPGEHNPPGYQAHERLIFSMVHAVRMLDVVSVSEAYAAGERGQLADLLELLDRDLQHLSREVSNRYLVHAGPSRRMTSAPAPSDPSESR